jgi:16S rRNA (cytosine1402-N4)-methyltransferase
MNQDTYHIPALLTQSLDALQLRPNGVYVDCTYGGGGHSRAIIEHLDAAQNGHLYGFDQDKDAVERAISDPRFTIVYSNFRYLVNFMRYYDVDGVDGILADLGVSFHHFDDPDRGFSFRWQEGALDMRMNQNARLSAAEVINEYTPERLTELFKLYGEMQGAKRFANAICNARAKEPVRTTEQLLAAVRPLINPRQEKKELAQLFQALRIEVNDEIGALRTLLQSALGVLKPGGRLAIITYHSLEDRLVKNFMKTGNLEGNVEKDFFGRSLAPMRMLNAKPIVPDDDEVARNPRSRSAKLRIATKLDSDDNAQHN